MAKSLEIFHLHCSQNLTNLESLYFFGFGVFCLGLGGGGVWMRSQVWKQVSYTDEKELPLEFFFYFFYLQKGAATGVGCGNGDKQEP